MKCHYKKIETIENCFIHVGYIVTKNIVLNKCTLETSQVYSDLEQTMKNYNKHLRIYKEANNQDVVEEEYIENTKEYIELENNALTCITIFFFT